MIDESFPDKWIYRPRFSNSRKLLILMWLFCASNVLLWSYKSTLLSTLVPIYYEDPINTFDDIERSGLLVLVPNNTAPHRLMAADPRPIVQRIFRKATLYRFNGTTPIHTVTRYLTW